MLEQVFVGTLALTILVAGVFIALCARRVVPPRVAALTIVACALALAVRVWLAPPVLLHANFHGAALVDSILEWPAPAAHRAEYGQGSFFVLGALARLFGGGFRTIAWINQVLAVATLALLGVYAARLSGRPRAAWVAVALGALHPGLARVAASEDAHTLATFLGALALIGLDLGGVGSDPGHRGRVPALVLGASAALLMIWTRQTLYPWALVVVALVLARVKPNERRRPDLLLALGVVVVGLVVRVASTSAHPTDSLTLQMLPIILATNPGVLLDGHPLLMAPGALLAGAVGLVLLRRERGGYVLAAGALGLVAITLPFAMPTTGVVLTFRLPAVAFWIVPAAAALARSSRSLWLTSLAMLPITFAPFGETTAGTEEMRVLPALARELPSDAVIVTLPTREPMPSYHLPRFALPPGIDVERAGETRHDPTRPRFFLAGVQCHAWSIVELMPGESIATYLDAAMTGRVLEVPSGGREECRGHVPSRTVSVRAPAEPPFAYFDGSWVPVGFASYDLANIAVTQSAAPPNNDTTR